MIYSTLKEILRRLYDVLTNDMETLKDSAISYANFVDMTTFVPWYGWEWQWKFTHDTNQYEISHESAIDKETYRIVFAGYMFAYSLMGNLSLYKGEQQILSVSQ